MTILAVRDLVVSYGRIEAVRGVSLEVPVAGIATVIGANGAGKSTLLNAIMGLLPAQGGIAFDGRDLHDVPVEDRVAGGLCLVPERRELFGAMTVEDNLRLGAFRAGRDRSGSDLEAVYARFPRLKERGRAPPPCPAAGGRCWPSAGRG